jgi:hypothetical protein
MASQIPVFSGKIAAKAEKLVVDLGVAHNRTEIAFKVKRLNVLSKGSGTFTLTFHFYDGTEFTLDNTEIADGDSFKWYIERLYITNTAQAGATVKLIAEY